MQVSISWFNECCFGHDKCYDEAPKCPPEEAKKAKNECDDKFKGCMSDKCAAIGGVFIRGVCYLVGDFFGWAVTTFGDAAFKNARPGDTPDDHRFLKSPGPDPRAWGPGPGGSCPEPFSPYP